MKFDKFETNGRPRLDEYAIPLDINVGIPYFGLLAAVLGASKNSRIIHETLSFYGLSSEVPLRIGFDNIKKVGGEYVILDDLISRIAVGYGFHFEDKEQVLEDDGIIYSTGLFGYDLALNPSYVIGFHRSLSSWQEKTADEKNRQFWERFYLLGCYQFISKQKRRFLRLTQNRLTLKK